MRVVEIVFACCPVTDLRRARGFYEDVLGLRESRFFGSGEQGFVEYDIGPTTLTIGNAAPDWKPSPGGGSVGPEMGDFDAAIAHLKSSRYAFRLQPMETAVCHMAVVSDPDGNSVTIHQRKAG